MSKTELLDGYASEGEFAKQLGVVERTTRNMRARGDGPPYVKIGNRVYYSVDGIRKWLESREIKPVRSRRSA